MESGTFFWHDYETFGRDPRSDRPAQFAGQRTDAELNPVGDPVVLHCRPPRDRLPDPESVLLTGILPQHCAERGIGEAAFAAAIEAELARPGTTGVGYNSIRFDDEVTRFLFWRNLLDPYAREWQDGCSRWDLLDVVRCCWSLRPDGIEWPLGDDRRPSFRLELLSAANGLQHAAAHDALSDVHATIALARLIRQRKARLWAFCLRLRHKAAVQAEIVANRPLLHVSGRYPVERGCLAIVWPFAPHPVNRNEVIVWDLAYDPAELMALSAGQIRERLFVRSDELPPGQARLPIKTIHLNRSPVVIGTLETLSDARAEHWGIDKALALRHAETAARIAGEMLGVWEGVFAREAPGGPVDVDEDLYGGFLGDDDRRTLRRLRRLAPDELAAQARRVHFRDERLAELVFRYRARNHPGQLDAEEAARWHEHCRARLVGGAGGAVTLAAFLERIDALAEPLIERGDARGQALLEALVDFAESIAPDA